MKKLFLLLLIFPLLFVACSSDDDDDELIDNELVGTWNFDPAMAKAEIVNDLEGNRLAARIEDEIVEDFGISSMTLEGSGNASVVLSDGSRRGAEWAAAKGKFAINFSKAMSKAEDDAEEVYVIFTYAVNGKNLVLKNDQTTEMRNALKKGEFNSILDASKNESFEKTSITKVEVILEAKKK